MENTKRIIEVNGIKLEVDLRHAKRIDEFKVGSAVKVLVKEYSSYKSHFGMIVGFDEFKALPTIIVAYIDPGAWSSDPLKLVYINEKTENVEICAQDQNDVCVEKGDILDQFDRQMLKKKEEIRDIEVKKKYFIDMFGRFFEKNEESNVG